MPIIKSAQKRMRQEQVRRERNLLVKRDLKNKSKAFDVAVESKNSAKITTAQNELYSALDTAAKKNLIHKNKAARKKATASAKAKAAGAKVTKSAKPAAKAKATTAKKTTATKKPATKK